MPTEVTALEVMVGAFLEHHNHHHNCHLYLSIANSFTLILLFLFSQKELESSEWGVEDGGWRYGGIDDWVRAVKWIWSISFFVSITSCERQSSHTELFVIWKITVKIGCSRNRKEIMGLICYKCWGAGWFEKKGVAMGSDKIFILKK